MEWVKIIHLLCVMGWMTSIFAVPRALIFWKREYERLGENGPLGDLTFRLYRFSNMLSFIAIAMGLWLAWDWGFPTWSLVKLALVVVLIVQYEMTGRMVRRAKQGIFNESDMFLRIFNESSVIGVIAILWLVVSKPF
ncbi:CopD family protein [Planktotalea sp.]|uniref:CopD family protein n=1 Tax=Planktotalea sp. TaxID=2029877 RepID=UPI003D6BD856